jgi:hypothetical protein
MVFCVRYGYWVFTAFFGCSFARPSRIRLDGGFMVCLRDALLPQTFVYRRAYLIESTLNFQNKGLKMFGVIGFSDYWIPIDLLSSWFKLNEIKFERLANSNLRTWLLIQFKNGVLTEKFEWAFSGRFKCRNVLGVDPLITDVQRNVQLSTAPIDMENIGETCDLNDSSGTFVNISSPVR